VRYADDFILGFAGSKASLEIKKLQELREELRLEMSKEKTSYSWKDWKSKISRHEISVAQNDTKIDKRQRGVNGQIRLYLAKGE